MIIPPIQFQALSFLPIILGEKRRNTKIRIIINKIIRLGISEVATNSVRKYPLKNHSLFILKV